MTSLDGRGEQALDETVRAGARHDARCQRNEGERHEEVGDDAVAIDPGVLRRGGGNASKRQQHDAGAEPRELASHRRVQFFAVKSANHGALTLVRTA